MNVKINNETANLNEGTTVATLAGSRNLPERGIAIAINNEMVPRGEWAVRKICDGDDIVILKAFCGG
ncbi:sulfur carrier protein ThiS [Xylanibacter muris]|uniref:Sulfur carrier protein ThiS n=1 Tax=Xylanibacter muris TaxID=2736290 RepID=A0ABX2ASY3_9BACT|nr:sulfur carrier protein ThiS [Xylanibacter muris]NPD93056.1 sulfur carrier protein ThiS [Xylanibacter muris]